VKVTRCPTITSALIFDGPRAYLGPRRPAAKRRRPEFRTTGDNTGTGFLNRDVEVDENGYIILAEIIYAI
jgi:hypothetical protein